MTLFQLGDHLKEPISKQGNILRQQLLGFQQILF